MKFRLAPILACLALVVATPDVARAQTTHAHTDGMDHSAMTSATTDAASSGTMDASMPIETGQSAFAAIAEIVTLLRADPETNWQNVDIEGLRLHLMDMDAVTLHAGVAERAIDGGAVFEVTSPDMAITGSIRRMTIAHAAAMSGVDGIDMQGEEIAHGARLTVTGPDANMIQGLGFIGILTLGMHHQAHHFALARGLDPHQN